MNKPYMTCRMDKRSQYVAWESTTVHDIDGVETSTATRVALTLSGSVLTIEINDIPYSVAIHPDALEALGIMFVSSERDSYEDFIRAKHAIAEHEAQSVIEAPFDASCTKEVR
jgi:hypothetical protein